MFVPLHLSVRSVKSLGLEFPAYSHRVTANRHVACTDMLLALFESQSDLLRRQIGDRSGDRADVVGD